MSCACLLLQRKTPNHISSTFETSFLFVASNLSKKKKVKINRSIFFSYNPQLFPSDNEELLLECVVLVKLNLWSELLCCKQQLLSNALLSQMHLWSSEEKKKRKKTTSRTQKKANHLWDNNWKRKSSSVAFVENDVVDEDDNGN